MGSPARGRMTRCSSVAVVGAGFTTGFSTVWVMRPPRPANGVPSVKYGAMRLSNIVSAEPMAMCMSRYL